jgi:hypothetical protein
MSANLAVNEQDLLRLLSPDYTEIVAVAGLLHYRFDHCHLTGIKKRFPAFLDKGWLGVDEFLSALSQGDAQTDQLYRDAVEPHSSNGSAN